MSTEVAQQGYNVVSDINGSVPSNSGNGSGGGRQHPGYQYLSESRKLEYARYMDEEEELKKKKPKIVETEEIQETREVRVEDLKETVDELYKIKAKLAQQQKSAEKTAKDFIEKLSKKPIQKPLSEEEIALRKKVKEQELMITALLKKRYD